MNHQSNRRRRGAPLDHAPEAVTYARQNAGLTKRELSRQLAVSEQYVGMIEAGTRNAPPALIARMAEILNCPPVVLEAKRYPAPVSGSADEPTAGAA